MASITLTRTKECAAQNHVVITMTGDVTHTFHGSMVDLAAPLTDAEKDALVVGLIKLARNGRAPAVLRDLLGLGVGLTL